MGTLKPVMNFGEFSAFCTDNGVYENNARQLFDRLDQMDSKADGQIDFGAIDERKMKEKITPQDTADRWCNKKLWGVCDFLHLSQKEDFAPSDPMDLVRLGVVVYRQNLQTYVVSTEALPSGAHLAMGEKGSDTVYTVSGIPPSLLQSPQVSGSNIFRLVVDPSTLKQDDYPSFRPYYLDIPAAFEPKSYEGALGLGRSSNKWSGNLFIKPYVLHAGFVGNEPAWVDMIIGGVALVAGAVWLFIKARGGKGGQIMGKGADVRRGPARFAPRMPSPLRNAVDRFVETVRRGGVAGGTVTVEARTPEGRVIRKLLEELRHFRPSGQDEYGTHFAMIALDNAGQPINVSVGRDGTLSIRHGLEFYDVPTDGRPCAINIEAMQKVMLAIRARRKNPRQEDDARIAELRSRERGRRIREQEEASATIPVPKRFVSGESETQRELRMRLESLRTTADGIPSIKEVDERVLIRAFGDALRAFYPDPRERPYGAMVGDEATFMQVRGKGGFNAIIYEQKPYREITGSPEPMSIDLIKAARDYDRYRDHSAEIERNVLEVRPTGNPKDGYRFGISPWGRDRYTTEIELQRRYLAMCEVFVKAGLPVDFDYASVFEPMVNIVRHDPRLAGWGITVPPVPEVPEVIVSTPRGKGEPPTVFSFEAFPER